MEPGASPSRRAWHAVTREHRKGGSLGDGDRSGRSCRLRDLWRLRAAHPEGVALRSLVALGAGPSRVSEAEVPLSGRITADGSSGYPAEAGRYHLYISWACPWAHRSAIVRALVGIEDVVSLSAVDPIRDGRGWAFRDGPGYGHDPVNGFRFLKEAYLATDPEYDGHVSVPVLWDKQTSRIVSNNFPDISLDLGSEFSQWATSPLDLYPRALRTEIDVLNEQIYESVNDGVYRTGFARSQEQYERNVGRVFETLDELEQATHNSSVPVRQ